MTIDKIILPSVYILNWTLYLFLIISFQKPPSTTHCYRNTFPCDIYVAVNLRNIFIYKTLPSIGLTLNANFGNLLHFCCKKTMYVIRSHMQFCCCRNVDGFENLHSMLPQLMVYSQKLFSIENIYNIFRALINLPNKQRKADVC